MKDLRERAEILIAGIEHGDEEHRKWLRETFTPQIESFAREIRNEALEEAADAVWLNRYEPPYTIENRSVNSILALKMGALAAAVPEEKGNG